MLTDIFKFTSDCVIVSPELLERVYSKIPLNARRNIFVHSSGSLPVFLVSLNDGQDRVTQFKSASR